MGEVQVDLTRRGGFTAALHWLNAIPNGFICEFVAEESTNLREQITRQKLRAGGRLLGDSGRAGARN